VELKNATVTDICDVYTVYSAKGRYEKMRDRRTYGLSLCADGQITYIQNGKKFISNTNVAVILPKGKSYDIHGDKAGSFPVINFDCLEYLCDEIQLIPIQNSKQMMADYERINKLFHFDGNRAQIFSIFYGMLHRLSFDNIPYELKNAMQMIKNDYNDPSLTNARLADECNMSEVYFRKLFSKYFNTSPKQFVIDVRLQKAKQLLTEGVLNVSLISESCGFSNPYHFCRIFKQYTGMTPSEYRKENLVYKI